MFMAILDIQIVASSLPEIQASLRIPMDRLSWIQTAYLIAEIIAIPLTGWFTRLLSLRGLFLASVTIFTLASVGCALSPGFFTLLVFRAIQGFFGGAMIPAVFTGVFALFPERLHVRATAIAGAFAMLAPTLGPILGGYITETYSWHWLFLINLGPGLIAGGIAAWLLRTPPADRSAMGRLDWPSLGLMAISLTCLQLGLKEAPERGWYDPTSAALLVVAFGTGLLGVRRCFALARPLIDLRPLKEPGFGTGCVLSFVLGAGLYGSVYLLPLFLGYVRQHTAFEIGQIMLVSGVAQLLTAPVAAILEKRIGPRILAGLGYGLFTAGLLANGFTTFESDFDALFWPQILRGVGVMFCILPTTSVALEGRSGGALADASGLFNLMRNLGGAVWIAVVDTILLTRPEGHAARLVERLQAGDPEAARFVGLPLDRFQNVPLGPVDEATRQFVQPLVERAAAVASFNEAWLLTAVCCGLSLLLLPLLKRRD